MFRLLLSACVAVLVSSPLSAHEFWIDPVNYQVPSGQNVLAHFRVGQDFKAPASGFLENNTAKHAIGRNGKVFGLYGRSGDRPAMKVPQAREGLLVLIHETKDLNLTYKEWPKFVKFVDHKKFDGVLELHKSRGLPDAGFQESYRRYAKSLVKVGNGAGQDFVTGLKIEIVALKNPYTDDLSGGLPVQVLLDGAPRANVQVELYEKQGGPRDSADEVTTYTTNSQGIAFLPVKSGRTYMADNVALLPVENDDPTGIVWHSIWANLTFQTP